MNPMSMILPRFRRGDEPPARTPLEWDTPARLASGQASCCENRGRTVSSDVVTDLTGSMFISYRRSLARSTDGAEARLKA